MTTLRTGLTSDEFILPHRLKAKLEGGLRMSVALNDPNRFYSREEYRRWCESQPSGRYERVDGRIVAMAPERIAHARVKGAVYRALERAVTASGVPCEALPDGVTVETGENDYEPDALVNCGTLIDGDTIAATNPVIIVEVLSPGTASTDTGGKLAGYFQVPSVKHYLIIHPARRVVTHHRRTSDGIATQIIVSGAIVMHPPGITISVEDIYPAGTP
jgi:Uma2 family endonuclease